MRTTVTYAGINLEVVGKIMPAIKERLDEPPQQSYIEEMSVNIGDVSITELISDDDFSKIEKLAMEAVS